MLTNNTPGGEGVDILGLTADIVAAYVQNNATPTSGLPELILSVNAALTGLARQELSERIAEPAINPKKSVTADYIICLEDGKRFKSMKRHLANTYGLTPDEYRAKWGLAKDYPMAAPNYSAQRSVLAKSSGLGRKPGQSRLTRKR